MRPRVEDEQETEKTGNGTRPVALAARSGTGSALSVKEAEDFVKYHNRVRAEVGSPTVTWSSTLARYAQEWANHIAETGEIVHRPQEGEWVQKYGENWAIGTDLPPSMEPVSKLGLMLPTCQPCSFAEA